MIPGLKDWDDNQNQEFHLSDFHFTSQAEYSASLTWNITFPLKSAAGYVSVDTQEHDGNKATELRAGYLSNTQLVLRRGLTALAAVGLLSLGVGVHVLVPLPEIVSNSTLDNTTYADYQTFPTALVPTEALHWA